MHPSRLASLLLLLFCGAALAEDAGPVAKIAEAGKRFLATLDDTQRAKVSFDFKDAEQRKRWSNLPVSMVRRAGLRMGDLKDPQREAVWALLESACSPQGYQKVREIVQADEVLKNESAGAGRPAFGRDEYFISLLGQPSATEPWMIQFGGHHLALNITLVGNHATLAPSHTAAQPAIYQFEGKRVRPLGREADKAFELMTSLDETQRKQAILSFEIRDLVLGPGRDGESIQPEGIKGSALKEKQRAMLLDLAAEWIGIQNDASAKTKMEDLKQDVADTWFCWSGPTEKGAAAYFRIQGPTAIIEYAPQRLGGDTTKHIHTIYRDPTNEYGSKWWKK